MKKIKGFIFWVLLTGMLSNFLAGCNTIEGMGEDIERGGEAIQEAVD